MTSENEVDDGASLLNHALRAYKIRLLLLVILGAGLLGVFLSTSPVQQAVQWIPFLAIGESLISASVVGFVYEWFARKETDRALTMLIKNSSKGTARLISDRLVRQTFLSEDGLASFSKNEKELALRSALAAWTENHEVASEIATNVLPQFSSKGGYWKRVRYEVQFEPDSGDAAGSGRYLDVYLTCEYTARLSRDRFVIHLDWGEGQLAYAAIESDTYQEYSYSAGFTSLYELDDDKAFSVESVEIDGIKLRLDRTVVRNAAGAATLLEFEGNERQLKGLVGREVRHRVNLKIKVPKIGHFIVLPLIRSAIGVECVVRAKLKPLGIHQMSVVPILQSGGSITSKEDVSQIGAFTGRAETSRAVFSGSGVFVIWKLEGEYEDSFNFHAE